MGEITPVPDQDGVVLKRSHLVDNGVSVHAPTYLQPILTQALVYELAQRTVTNLAR